MRLNELKGLYKDQSCFLICDGPSFSKVDLRKLETTGVLTVGVNNSPATFRTDIWLFADSPDKFLDSLKHDPRILKVSRMSNEKLLSPPFAGIDINTEFNIDTYLDEETVSFGKKKKDGGVRSVLLLALKSLYLLGFRNVYLLGVDFEMKDDESNYHFDQETPSRHVTMNNNAYKVLSRRLETLQPRFKISGFNVYNCNKDSKLKAFPFVDLDDAIVNACDRIEDPSTESTKWMYTRSKINPPRIRRRTFRKIDDEKLKVICVLKSGGDYDIDDVINLKRLVTPNISVNHEFVCYSDIPEVGEIDGVTFVKLRNNFSGWWSKLEIFREIGHCVFFDLDTYITKPIDAICKWASEEVRQIAMLRGWRKRPDMWCSGVMSWSGDYSYLLSEFDKERHTKQFKRGGDQEYISRSIEYHNDKVKYIEDLVRRYSYKWECKDGVPDDAEVVCFHGKPRPRTVGAPFWIKDERAECGKSICKIPLKLSKPKDFVFIHIPKTGGTSVKNMLRSSGNRNFHTHSSVTDFNERYGNYFFKEVAGFAIIRNPYARLVSAYFWGNSGASVAKPERDSLIFKKSSTFVDFCRNIESMADERKSLVILKPQCEYVRDIGGDIPIDLYPLERINDFINRLKNEYSIKITGDIEVLNKTEHDPFMEYHTPETIEITKRIYSTDIDLYEKLSRS